MRVDLHGLPLSDAKLKSQIAVAEAWESSQPSIELVHGHNLGTVIKDYVQKISLQYSLLDLILNYLIVLLISYSSSTHSISVV